VASTVTVIAAFLQRLTQVQARIRLENSDHPRGVEDALALLQSCVEPAFASVPSRRGQMGLLGTKARAICHESVTRSGNRNEIQIQDPLYPTFVGAAEVEFEVASSSLDSHGDLFDQFPRYSAGLASQATPQNGRCGLVVGSVRIEHRIVKSDGACNKTIRSWGPQRSPRHCPVSQPHFSEMAQIVIMPPWRAHPASNVAKSTRRQRHMSKEVVQYNMEATVAHQCQNIPFIKNPVTRGRRNQITVAVRLANHLLREPWQAARRHASARHLRRS
jgi:hypothetical protein